MMCEIVEEYAKEKVDEAVLENAKENAKNFFENGCSLEMVLASIKNIPEEVIRKLYEEVVGTKSI